MGRSVPELAVQLVCLSGVAHCSRVGLFYRGQFRSRCSLDGVGLLLLWHRLRVAWLQCSSSCSRGGFFVSSHRQASLSACPQACLLVWQRVAQTARLAAAASPPALARRRAQSSSPPACRDPPFCRPVARPAAQAVVHAPRRCSGDSPCAHHRCTRLVSVLQLLLTHWRGASAWAATRLCSQCARPAGRPLARR